MKKLLVYLLLPALLFCTAGCRRTSGEPSAPMESGAVSTEFPGVDVRIAGLNTGGSEVKLKVLWRNQTAYPVTYGEPYTIERLESGHWVSCAKQTESAFLSIGYALKAFDKAYKTYTVSDLFDVTAPGTYRFCSSCSVLTGKGSNVPCKVTAEFTVGEQGSTPLQEPPQVQLSAPESTVTLKAAGYHWTCDTGNGKAVSTIADQVSRPTPADSTEAITVKVQSLQQEDASGCLMQLQWPATPASVTYTCWPCTVWQGSAAGEETVISQGSSGFYAKPGNVYEIAATWDDTGAGYYGSANYYVYAAEDSEHTHQPAAQPQTVDDPITGYCGNTQTSLYIADKKYSFMDDRSVTLTDLLVNLDYDPNHVCRCLPQYRVDTELGKNYHIHLDYGFARCEKGQAALTQEQIDTISRITQWAETTLSESPLD